MSVRDVASAPVAYAVAEYPWHTERPIRIGTAFLVRETLAKYRVVMLAPMLKPTEMNFVLG